MPPNMAVIKKNLAEMLRQARAQRGLTQKALATKLGLESDVTVSKWERSEIPIAWHHFDRLIDALHLDRKAFLDLVQREIPDAYALYQRYTPHQAEASPTHHRTIRADRAPRLIPVINQAACGKWRDFTDLDFPSGQSDRQEAATTADPHAFYIIASGDSMIGSKIEDGDLLLVEPGIPVEDGHIVLAKNHEGCTVKKFFRHAGHIELRPMNEAHKSIFVKDDSSLRIYRISQIVKRI